MPSTWLLALKVIPWGDVLEHAPQVLSAARKLLERQRTPQTVASPPDSVEAPGTAQPSLTELNARLFLAQQQIESLGSTQLQLTQTVAELAEQNARLVEAVEVMRKRSRWFAAALAVLATGLLVVGLNGA
jgi:hypothetical protein